MRRLQRHTLGSGVASDCAGLCSIQMSVLQRAGGSPGFPVVSEPSPASDWSTVSQFPSIVRMAVEGEIQPLDTLGDF